MTEVVEITKQIDVNNVEERGVWLKINCYGRPVVKCPDCGSWSMGSTDHAIDEKGITDKPVVCGSRCGWNSIIRLVDYVKP